MERKFHGSFSVSGVIGADQEIGTSSEKRTRPACKDAKSPKEVCAKSAPYNGQNRELPIIPLQGVKRDTIYINGLGLNWQQNRKAAFPASYRKNRSAALSIYAPCNRMVTAVFSAQVIAQELTHTVVSRIFRKMVCRLWYE